jgi:hypothetical protein
METSTIRILSVGHANQVVQLLRKSGDSIALLSVVEQVIKEDRIRGDANDYHNLAVVFSRDFDDYTSGYEIVNKGLQYNPNNVDLLADAIYYGSSAGKYAECEKHREQLEKLPLPLWNWRAYSFLIDYFLQKTDWSENPTDAEMLELTERALKYAKIEQIALSGDAEVERGYLAEHKIRVVRERYYRLLSRVGKLAGDDDLKKKAEEESKKAEEILYTAINDDSFAATACCLKLADILFDQKKYKDTIRICNIALRSPQSQPSANIGYFMYLIAMSEDALLHEQALLGDEASVKNCYRDYVGAFRCNGRFTYRENITNRLAVLEAKTGFPAPELT